MVLHILSDDKFTDYAINQFMGDDMQSEMVVIPSGAGHSFTKCEKVSIVKYPSQEFTRLVNNLHNYSGIVLHGLFWPYMGEIIRKSPDTLKIAWYFWGAEIYSRPDLMNSFIAPLTKLLFRIHNWKNKTNINNIQWHLPIDLFKRIDFSLTSMYEEFKYAKEYIDSDMQFIWYTYYSIEDTIGNLISQRRTGNNVMFCNSAALENNMFDAMLRMQCPSYKKQIKDKEVVMPLSYGFPWIKNLMLQLGPKCFNKFIPLVNFIPREQYNEIMINCSTLILPYHSPAGQGNIITALWLGLRVYLSEKCIAYKYFNRLGIKIFSFESDFTRYGCEPLTDNIVEHNKKILLDTYSRKRVNEANRHLIDVLEGNNATE